MKETYIAVFAFNKERYDYWNREICSEPFLPKFKHIYKREHVLGGNFSNIICLRRWYENESLIDLYESVFISIETKRKAQKVSK